MTYRDLSFWWDSLPEALAVSPGSRDALAQDAVVDVAVVGGGYTGLWTAYWLLRADPSLRVLVLEREVAGFGASGRNGGWCSALFPASWASLATASGREAAVRLQRTMFSTVTDIGDVLAEEGIDAHWQQGGTVSFARTQVQLQRARDTVAKARSWGFSRADVELLDADGVREHAHAADALGGVFTPHCAAVHPARLVRGLAEAVERRGGRIAEGTEVLRITPGLVHTSGGNVRAEVVVRATEGYTAGLPGHRRSLVPVYSLMIATEPLDDEVWRQIGLAGRATFNELSHMIVYGQRTTDGRLAFGGRGAPYRFASTIHPRHEQVPSVHTWLRERLRTMFPVVADAEVTHTWGGALGIARDWWASVGLDRANGLAWAGGYVGDGVATSHLAGRTLADLIVGETTARTTLPWVGHRSPRWEPEPLRWLGVNAGLRAMALADPEEARTRRSSAIASVFGRLIHGQG